MPTPLPPKGTVLQTAEFADSLYSPIFRGAGCALTIPTGALVRLSARVVALYRGCPHGFCILRILDIFSACEVWFTFIYRKQEHLAVGSSGNGLTCSRGHPPFVVASPSPVVS